MDIEECVIDKKKYHRTESVLKFNQKCIEDIVKRKLLTKYTKYIQFEK